MAYKPQYYPGNTSVAKNRRKHMSNEIEKLRDISDEDLTAILGHRAPGSDYPSTHPPLSEMGEPDCPIREIVEPTTGAAAGDRVRYVQFADSMYNAPSTPYFRSYHAAMNFRGCDPGTLSGRQIVEMRERDLEAFAKKVSESEMTDWGLAGMRGCTVHGHSLRLQEDGTMFDMLDRRRLEGGFIVMDKDQVGVPIDRKVNLGKMMSEAEAAKRTTLYRVDNVAFRSDNEVIEHVQRIWEHRTAYGFLYDNVNFRIVVKTGDIEDAGTDANVYITLYGTNGESEEKKLDYPEYNDFEQGSSDFYRFRSLNLGDIDSIRIRHDNTGHKPGWFLDYIRVILFRDTFDRSEWMFPCYQWFTKKNRDKVLFASSDIINYNISVQTGNMENADTRAKVYITLYGTNGESEEKRLRFSRPADKGTEFRKGAYDEFDLQLPNLGEINKIKIRHDNSGKDPGWFLEYIDIKAGAQIFPSVFNCYQWLTKDYGISRILYIEY